jgi:hypothetical protein
MQVRTPRGRQGTFEPKIVRKRQRLFEVFDDKIIALYSRGLSRRDIEAHLRELYGVSAGRDWITPVTDAGLEAARRGGSARWMTSTRCSFAAQPSSAIASERLSHVARRMSTVGGTAWIRRLAGPTALCLFPVLSKYASGAQTRPVMETSDGVPAV